MLCSKRSHHNEKPVPQNKEERPSPLLEKAHTTHRRPRTAKNKIETNKNLKCYIKKKKRISAEIRTHVHCQWECKKVQPLWKTVWKFLKELKIETTT